MSEFAPPIYAINNKPVIVTDRKSVDTEKVIQSFLASPLDMNVLYHNMWRLTWPATDNSHTKVVAIWAIAQLCHVSWLPPCPAICKPIPVTADAANAIGRAVLCRMTFLCLLCGWKQFHPAWGTRHWDRFLYTCHSRYRQRHSWMRHACDKWNRPCLSLFSDTSLYIPNMPCSDVDPLWHIRLSFFSFSLLFLLQN